MKIYRDRAVTGGNAAGGREKTERESVAKLNERGFERCCLTCDPFDM